MMEIEKAERILAFRASQGYDFSQTLEEYRKIIRTDAIDEVIHKINEHRTGLKADFDAKDISEEDYSYRDDECLWIIEILEQLKEQK